MSPRHGKRWIAGFACGAALLGAQTFTAAVPASALADGNAASGPVTSGFSGFLSADPAAVRALGGVPDRWQLLLDSAGKARIFFDMVQGSMTVDGQPHQMLYTVFGAVLASVPSPERSRDTSGAFGSKLDFYLLSWDFNDRAIVDWMRAGTGLSSVVHHVPGMTYNLSSAERLSPSPAFPPGPVHDFRFNEPSPAQSPFSFTAAVTDQFFPIPPRSNFWRQTPGGTVMIDVSHPDAGRFAVSQQWQLTTPPSSELGQMIGNGGVQRQVCDPNVLFSPLLELAAGTAEQGCLASDSYPLPATWRKDLPPAATSTTPSASTSRTIGPNPTRPAGAIRTENPAAGRAPRTETHVPTHARHMSRLMNKVPPAVSGIRT